MHLDIFIHLASQASLNLGVRALQIDKNVMAVRPWSWLNKLKQDSSSYFSADCDNCCSNRVFAWLAGIKRSSVIFPKVIPHLQVRLVFPEPFSLCGGTELPSDHSFASQATVFHIISFISMVCLFVFFGFTWIETYLLSSFAESTVCMLMWSNKFTVPKFTRAFVCILCFCVHLAVKHEDCTAFKFQ